MADQSLYNIIESRQKSTLSIERLKSKTKSQLKKEPTFIKSRSKTKSLLKEATFVRQGTLLLRESVRREATVLQKDHIKESEEPDENKHLEEKKEVEEPSPPQRKYNILRHFKPKEEFKLTEEEKEQLKYDGIGAPTKDWYERGLDHFKRKVRIASPEPDSQDEDEDEVEPLKNSDDEFFESDEDDFKPEDLTPNWALNDKNGGRTYYLTCKKLNLCPMSAVIHNLDHTDMRVNNVGLCDVDALAVFNALSANSSITDLELTGNRLGEKGIQYLCLYLNDAFRLTSLTLSNNTIGKSALNMLCNVIREGAAPLQKLNLSATGLGSLHIYNICQLIIECHLTSLNLSHNQFDDEAAMEFAPVINANDTLHELDLSWNQLSPKGGVAICYAIEDNCMLKSVNLSMNGLGDQGAMSLDQTLRNNPVLLDLDISFNRITDEGIIKLAKGLRWNETLQKLRLHDNPLTTISAMALLNVINSNKNSSMKLLDMSGIHVHINVQDTVKEINQQYPHFVFKHGRLLVNENVKNVFAANRFAGENPMKILHEYIKEQGLRMVDFFKQMDEDGGGSISREEFVAGLKTIDVPLTDDQLNKLIDMLDEDGDGEVDYGELMRGEREFRRKELRRRLAAEKKAKEAKAKKKANS